jgi:hypothetical protein
MACFLLLLTLGLTGCSSSTPPALRQKITAVRLSVAAVPPAAACTVTITTDPALAEITGWLQKIDWSQRGTDPAVINVPPPDGSIQVTTEEGGTAKYGFYWDGGFMTADRFIRGGDMAELRRLIQAACK